MNDSQPGQGREDPLDWLRRVRRDGDDRLAQAIEADARGLLSSSRPVQLDRYLGAIPDLPMLPVSLDAAIEFALRSLTQTPMAPEIAVARLISAFPGLAEQIRTAAVLNRAMWSTGNPGAAQERLDRLPLPAEIGPTLPTGRARFQLTEVLGTGSFGTVYLAVDRQLSEPDRPAWVALKVLRTRPGDAPEQARLAEEATKARRISHPNVVRVLDRGVTADGAMFIVYEHVDGQSLSAWLESRPGALPERSAAELVAKVAHGVRAAHAAGLLHCDLKPDNILITRAGEPKVTDFGSSARLRGQETIADGAARDSHLGNMAFMAPERYRGEPGAISPSADVYALGGLLYYLLTRSLPNGGTLSEIATNLDALTGRREAPGPRLIRPDVSPDLDAICRRALAARSADRYESADGLARDLEAFCADGELSWRPSGRWRRFRRYTRREPLAVLVITLISVGFALLAWRVGVVSSHANTMAAEAVTASQRADYERQLRQQVRSHVESYMKTLKASRTSDFTGDWLTVVSMLEWLTGPLLFDRNGGDPAWDDRVETVQAMITRARNEGHGNDAEILLWETTMAYWMMRQSRFEEADAIFSSNRERWGSILNGSDGWLQQIDFMRACAAVGRLAALKSEPDRLSETDRSALTWAEATLARAPEFFSGVYRDCALHREVLSARARLYGPDLLNIPDREREYRRELNHLIYQE